MVRKMGVRERTAKDTRGQDQRVVSIDHQDRANVNHQDGGCCRRCVGHLCEGLVCGVNTGHEDGVPVS